MFEKYKIYNQNKFKFAQTASKTEQIALCQYIRDGHINSQTRKIRRLYSSKTKDFYSSLEDTNKLCIKSYSDLLQQAKQYNKDYIAKYQEIESIYNPSETAEK